MRQQVQQGYCLCPLRCFGMGVRMGQIHNISTLGPACPTPRGGFPRTIFLASRRFLAWPQDHIASSLVILAITGVRLVCGPSFTFAAFSGTGPFGGYCALLWTPGDTRPHGVPYERYHVRQLLSGEVGNG